MFLYNFRLQCIQLGGGATPLTTYNSILVTLLPSERRAAATLPMLCVDTTGCGIPTHTRNLVPRPFPLTSDQLTFYAYNIKTTAAAIHNFFVQQNNSFIITWFSNNNS